MKRSDTKAALKMAGSFYPFILTILHGRRKPRKSWRARALKIFPLQEKPPATKATSNVFEKLPKLSSATVEPMVGIIDSSIGSCSITPLEGEAVTQSGSLAPAFQMAAFPVLR